MQRKLVLWGHDLDEYEEMFALSKKDLSLSILEYGCGLSAINQQLNGSAKKIVSIDPLFSKEKEDLFLESSIIFNDMIEIVKHDINKFNFEKYPDLDGFIAKRKLGIKKFFEDYDLGKKEGRYLKNDHFPIDFNDFTFDYALCSHYFFAGESKSDLKNYFEIIKELTRVAKEVRIFPLIDRFGQPAHLLGPLLLVLQNNNYGVEVKEVAYHLQPEGNAMLRIFAKECKLS